MGDEWPFTVDEGEVSCEGGVALYFTHNGQRYAVNGTAMTLKNAIDLRESGLWASPAKTRFPGEKIDIGPLMEKARSTCSTDEK